MLHDPHLTSLTIVVSVALVCGLALMRARQPAIVGYILAGAILGPSGFGLVSGMDNVRTLAELGVLLLLFLVGMELSLRAFAQIYRVALVAVAIQILLSLGFAGAVGGLLSWPLERALMIGFVLSCSSTAVTVKVLADIGELRSGLGRTVIGVLIAQDLAVVGMLLTMEALRPGASFDPLIPVRLLVALILTGALIVFLTRRERLRLPLRRAFGADPDVIPLAALALCAVAATLTGLLGLSTAFGAFLAGLVVGNSTERGIVVRATRPVQSVLLVVFFLSVGLLLDLGFIANNVGLLVALVLLATVIKAAIGVVSLRAARVPWAEGVLAGVALAQIGEFSFVLAGAGLAIGAIAGEDYKLAVAVIALSLIMGPVWVALERRLRRIADLGERLERMEAAARLAAAWTWDRARTGSAHGYRACRRAGRRLFRHAKRTTRDGRASAPPTTAKDSDR